MYVQVIEGQAKDAAGLRKQFDRWIDEVRPEAPGFLGSTAGVTDKGRFLAIARFASPEDARRNSDRPEQGEWWSETEKYLGDVTFYNCSDAHEWSKGGSDSAGFVQVMIGRTTDRAKLTEMDARSDEVAMDRPEVIGGVTAYPDESDDMFISTAYFTSEREAREGEKKEPSPEGKAMMDEWQGIITDISFYDLSDPWFAS